MVRLLLRLLLGITVLSALLIGAGTLVGHGVDTPLAAALISPQGDNTFDHTRRNKFRALAACGEGTGLCQQKRKASALRKTIPPL